MACCDPEKGDVQDAAFVVLQVILRYKDDFTDEVFSQGN